MSYKIHTTDAFVIKSRTSRDADSSLLLFTEEFGLLHAVATSARQVKSKLRFSLQALSFSSVSLVKGREVWRLTSAKKHISLYDKRLPIEFRSFFARLLLLVERFCPREVQESEIFATIKQIASFIFKQKMNGESGTVSEQEKDEMIKGLERMASLRILFELGYVKKDDLVADFIHTPFEMDIIKRAAQHAELAHIIERSITESHL